MYSIDSKDTVIELTDPPQSSIGAPCPMVLAGEHQLHLAYYIEDRPSDWDGTTIRVVSEDTTGEPVALVKFLHTCAHMFGPPNDEAFSGHPLTSRGLRPYAIHEVRHSSWVRRLERMNAVHPYHRPERYARYRHFIFTFHDTTFECVAESFSIDVYSGSVAEVLQRAFSESSK